MSKYLSYLHNLRGLAILYVVGVHARAFVPEWLTHPGVNRFFDTFFDPSEGNGTVLFLFIGGFLFQHLTHKQFEFGKYLEQKFKVIILPYLLISIPLIVLRLNTPFVSLSLPADFNERSTTYQVIHFILTGAHMPPFWFISTIVLFYLSAPLLHYLDKPFFYKYIFPFVFLTCLFTYRPAHNANPLLAYLHYIPVYMMGMWASFNREKILAVAPNLLYILVACYVSLCALDLIGWENHARETTFEHVIENGLVVVNIYIFKAVILCFMLLLMLYQLRDRQMPYLELLGNYSFGIFFIHYLYISLFRKVVDALHLTIDFSLPAYLIFFILILALSTGTVYLVKRLSGKYSRYVIGS
jgi:probable poly-beta-1,6-N-acetyl-D-glucosamine export protein